MPIAQGPVAIAILAALAGSAAADSAVVSGRATPVAHIYYNLATGERVATLLDAGARPADAGNSTEVWVADNTLPCSAYGQTSPYFGAISYDGSCNYYASCDEAIFLDWADLPFDSVIDCVGISWASTAADTDADGDGIGDGVPGQGGFWTWYDADNGFDSSATRQSILAIGLHDLPGRIPSHDPGTPSMYTATIDLASSFSSSLAFEIGDTDSHSDAPLFNPMGGQDLDSDGLADFAYSFWPIRPGRYDWDGDGSPDGVFDPRNIVGWPLATGHGTVSQSADGTYTYAPEPGSPGDTGVEDAYDLFTDIDRDGVPEPYGTFWFGGINCSSDPEEFNPNAQFYSVLYGPDTNPNCDADIYPPGVSGNGDGVLNVFDLMQFIQWYATQDPNADLWPPTTQGDGLYNFFDIVVYLQLYSACGP